MATIARNCGRCTGELPADASFCPKCGTPTPIGIDRQTGVIDVSPAPGAAELEQHRKRLQQAVGASVEIRGLLGRGGFAEVFVGWDVKLRRELAIKTLRSDLSASGAVLERFQREAQAIAGLRHPNIIPIYNVGEGDGIAYFSMPRVAGESLAGVLEREGQLDVVEACRILREAASALAHAHRAGVIHRDIKPENIMLEGAERSVLVMDFGIAKSTSAGEGGGLTGTGTIVGTPQYMSPEQATGERQLDARSDQYSLAMVGYAMLTGRLPFEADSVQSIIFKQVTERPAAIITLVGDVPAPVSDAIARALAKNPADRFPTIEEFGAALALADVGRGSEGVKRRYVDLPTRAAAMRKEFPGWRHPLTIAAVISVLMIAATFTRLLVLPAYELAGERDQAKFVATNLATTLGATSASVHPSGSVSSKDSLYYFLHDALGRDGADARASRDVPVWHWRFLASGGIPLRRWAIDVGPGNRIQRFDLVNQDTSTVADIGADSARALATQQIKTLGWGIDSLQPMPDSLVRRAHRTDRYFTWRRTTGAIPWHSDSATSKVHVTVAGNRVSSYDYSWEIPSAFTRSRQGSTLGDVVTGITTTIMVLIGLAIGVTAVARQRVDTLQWGTMLRFALAVAAIVLVAQLPSSVNSLQDGAGSAVSNLIIGLVVIGLMGGGWLFAAVTATESLTAESNPRAFGGLEDLVHGRVLTPEMATAAAVGLATGLVIEGMSRLNILVATQVFHMATPTSVSTFFTPPTAALSVLNLYGLAPVVVIPVLATIALARRYRAPVAVAIAIPAVLALGFFAGIDGTPAYTGVSSALSAALLGFVAWRWGFLAALIAAITTEIPSLFTLFQFGGAADVNGAVMALVLFAVPLICGFVAWRRFRTAPLAS
jgi:hypothetical protein